LEKGGNWMDFKTGGLKEETINEQKEGKRLGKRGLGG